MPQSFQMVQKMLADRSQRMVVARNPIKEAEALRRFEACVPRGEQRSYKKAESSAKP